MFFTLVWMDQSSKGQYSVVLDAFRHQNMDQLHPNTIKYSYIYPILISYCALLLLPRSNSMSWSPSDGSQRDQSQTRSHSLHPFFYILTSSCSGPVSEAPGLASNIYYIGTQYPFLNLINYAPILLTGAQKNFPGRFWFFSISICRTSRIKISGFPGDGGKYPPPLAKIQNRPSRIDFLTHLVPLIPIRNALRQCFTP